MQLSSFENITEDNIVFQAAKKFKIPNSKMKYERIKIERNFYFLMEKQHHLLLLLHICFLLE